jgi:hypothetical protein
MPSVRIDQQYLVDQAAIHDLHVRYFQGLDSGNRAQVVECFLPEVQAIYHNRPLARGIDALMADSLDPFFTRIASGHTRIATHFMGNFRIDRLEGDVADTEVYAIAFGVRALSPVDEVAMMSLRYMDRLLRTPDGWKIAQRVQSMDWSCQPPAATSMTMATRVMGLPAGNLA